MRLGSPPARFLALLAGCLAVGGCAETRNAAPYPVTEADTQAGPSGTFKVGKPYQIQGVWYYPSEDYDFDETGIASWYGPDFHGKYTANGERFDQNEVSGAHRTLPMPCFIRVTNLDNGRSLVVRVNDRGPFAHGRILDLSRRAAQLLGMELTGTAKVRVQIMADESRTLALQLKSKGEVTQVAAAPRPSVQAEALAPPARGREAPPPKARPGLTRSPPATVAAASEPLPDARQLETQQVLLMPVKPTQMYIQTGAFSQFNNAHRMSSALSGVGNATVTQVHAKGGALFRVRLGPLPTVEAADTLLERVIAAGYPDAKLVVD
jgi:rare lipoprotein A